MPPTALAKLLNRSGVRPRSIPARVLALLGRDPGRAWRLSEISKALSVAPPSLGPALTRLRAKGLVAQQAGHWHATRPASALDQAYAGTYQLAQERLGSEDPADWPIQ